MSSTDAVRSIEIIDETRISPASDMATAPTATAIPFGFLDLPWITISSVERVYVFDGPKCSALRFTEHPLPILKRSLSVALQRFYPLAGFVACPPPPGKPYISCSCDDAVTFTAAVSDADFNDIISDRPKPASLLRPLVPNLPPSYVKDDGIRMRPILAVQVTLFPESGICIGTEYTHAALDGISFTYFMKTWGSLCKAELQGDTNYIEKSLPVHDRTLLKDPNDLETVFLKQWYWGMFSSMEENAWTTRSKAPVHVDKLRATFTLTRAHIDRLKSFILDQAKEPLRVSSFVVTLAYIWPLLIRSKETVEEDPSSIPNVINLGFPADCKDRLGYPIPKTYIGNCLAACFIMNVKREDLIGPNGTILVARAIASKIAELEGDPLRGADHWHMNLLEMTKSGLPIGVAGSTRHRVYEMDFGWGRLKKAQVVHIDSDDSISIAESRDFEGGIEVGLALDKVSMDAFCAMFEDGLTSICGTSKTISMPL